MEVFRHLFDISYLYNNGGVDTVVYAGMALIGTALFILKMSLMLFLGMDGDIDADIDTGTFEHGAGFSLFSVLSVIGFIMGTGWAGLAARIEWGLDTGPSAIIAGGFGFFLMVLSSTLMFAAVKLTHEVKYDMKDAVGRTGTVYMTIPAKGQGMGQVRVSVSGRSMTVDAISTSEKIDAFTTVVIKEMRDDKVLVVSPSGD